MRWSDLHIIEPTLFNFYHGIELSLKALLVAKGEPIEKIHKLSRLLELVNSHYDSKELSDFYGAYLLTERQNTGTDLFSMAAQSNPTSHPLDNRSPQ